MTRATFKSSGKQPCLSDKLKILQRMGATASLPSLSSLTQILSSPLAFWDEMEVSSSKTCSTVISVNLNLALLRFSAVLGACGALRGRRHFSPCRRNGLSPFIWGSFAYPNDYYNG